MTKRVRETAPVQVYLGTEAQQRLERLAGQLGATKSDILRRGLLALERELLDPAAHPALRLIGMALSESSRMLDGEDAAREHDRVLAASEETSWAEGKRQTKRRPVKRRAR
jgi:hypothetical protein